ncbi:MAG: ABC transporter permease, partial [Phycisphaerae bacterium]
MLAVALGVGLVVAVSCCYESLRVSVTEWILSWLGRSQIHIEHRLGTSATFEQSLLEQVRRTEGVRLAAPRSRFWMTLIKPPYRPGAELPPQARLPVDCYGIEPTVEYQVRGYKLEAGRLLQPGEADAIVLQADLAETLHRRPGQSVMLEDATGKALQLRLVGTVVKPRLGPFQRSSAYVLLSRLQEMAYSRDKIHTIDVLVEPDASVQRVQQRLRDSLPPYVVIDTSESKLRHINDGMRLLNLVLLLNSICALLAAVF